MRALLTGILGAAFLCGCGMIADKDQIPIAVMDGKNITRGDLFRILYHMDDKERPRIRHRGDLLRVLNKMIDDTIKLPLGDKLAAEGRLEVPRDAAREQYFAKIGDEAEQRRWIYNAEIPIDPRTGECNITPLMRTYGLDCEQLRRSKDFIELETDRIVKELQADQAVALLAGEAFRAGELQADPALLEREYNLRRKELNRFERIVFRGIRLPATFPNAAEEAAGIRRRLDAGEDFDKILDEYLAKNRQLVTESEIENNPALEKFRNFWVAASGAGVGEIVGPVYLPQYQQMGQTASGQTKSIEQPDAFLIFRVLEHEPERIMTLEEAKPLLLPPLLIAQQMERLRAQRGVKIYEDNLPDPSAYGGSSGDPVLGF